jgi:hypothetical protein
MYQDFDFSGVGTPPESTGME